MSRGSWLVLALLAPTAASAQFDARSGETCILKPREVVHLGSPVSGLLARVTAERGDTVARGQEVATLESSIEEATLRLARAKAANDAPLNLERAELTMLGRKADRTRTLAAKQIESAASLDEAEARVTESRERIRAAEMDRALAALEADRAERTLALRQVRSPIDGVVLERKLSGGEYVYEQTPIMTIAQLDPLSVEVVMPVSFFGRIGHGQAARVRPAAPVGGEYSAVVEIVDPAIDAASDTFGVRLRLDNPGNKIPSGIRCEVTFETEQAGR